MLLALSCAREENIQIPEPSGVSGKVFGEGLPEAALLKEMNIRVSEELAAELEASACRGFVDLSGFGEIRSQGVVSMRRLFPYAGEFEERTRKAGLHLWYVLQYDESATMTRASSGLALPGVLEIEYCPVMSVAGNPETVSVEAAETRAGNGTYVFNDPMLGSQWHYYNNGAASSSVSGCDINVMPVWRSYSSYSIYGGDIIVGVVDGGIDYSHEDLKDNMWRNPDKTGNNVYGYNFAEDSYNIHPEDHGTHVAGTIAAVNNNGIGVCGVAGGDARAGIKGAKLMSCQIFDGKKQGSGAEAIKWSADHGAVISQNSWGYTDLTSTPSSLKSAVDYFINNAGIDRNGSQTGPMRGGIVIFAAGNDNRTVSGNDYEKILNVTSVGADYKRAYYTNYGPWCDVAAPGGDAKKGNQVLSTLPGDRYGKMQGTSMACPHVSGAAALILARYGGAGYTPDALRKRIEENVTDISAQNPSYYLGKGLVNVYKAVAGSGGRAPERPEGLSATAQSNNINFMVKVPADYDDEKAHAIYVYYSTSDFTSAAKAMFGVFYVEDLKAGQTLSGRITGVEFNTEYYLAAQAVDLAGNKSALTQRIRVTSGGNNAPVITPESMPALRLKSHEKAVAEFRITEPDGHFYSIVLEPGSAGAVLDTLVRDTPKIRITGADAPSGKYTAALTVTDFYGLSSSRTVDYEIMENNAPVVLKAMEDRIFTSKSSPTVEIPAKDCFYDEDGEELAYTFEFSNPEVANMTCSKGIFFLTPMNYGVSEIKVSGKDIRGASVSQSFRVLVSDGDRPATVYPNPVKDRLNIRVGKETADVHVRIISSAGTVFFNSSMGAADPFSPLSIDMSAAFPGSYTAVLCLDGNEYKYQIVKI